MTNEKKDIINVGMPDDYLFVKQMQGRDVRLSNFKKILKVVLESEGQNQSVELKSTTYDFLIKDIQVFAFYQGGNFMPNGVAKDLVTLTLKNTSTDDYLVDAGTDIQAYSPSNFRSGFTPTIFPAGVGLLASFKHERKVSPYCLDFPKNEAYIGSLPLSFGHGVPPPAEISSTIAPNPFPIYLQLVLSGAKIFALK